MARRASSGSSRDEPRTRAEGSPLVRLHRQEAAAQLAAAVGTAPDSLTCPGDLTAEVGTEMRCELTAGDATYGLTITVTAVDDESAEFDVVVDDAPVGG